MGTAAGLMLVGCNEKGTSSSDNMPASDSGSSATTQAVDMQKYSEIHDCAGMNACKGLGGCHVDAAKLAKLAEKAGTPMDKAGDAHDCAGLNACKGLGGCHVDAAKLQKLKAKLAG
jgi:hypothetical protein